jgi:pimeloyl-ACP methyl ester carboxylesterase
MNIGSARQTLIAEAGANHVSLSAAGSTASVLVAGRGQSLLLLHGFNAAGGLVWWPVFPTLSENFRVVAPDLPGLGESEALQGRLSAARVVEWLENVIGECCVGPAVLVATSMGAAFGLRFAVSHPEMLQRLILTDAQGLAPFRPPLGFFLAANLNSLRPSQATARRLTRYVIHNREHVRPLHGPVFDTFLAYMISRGGRAEVKRAMRGFGTRANARPVQETALAGLDLPVGLIWGRHDRPFPVSIAEDASSRFGWPLKVIEDAGHLPYVEQPHGFTAALNSLLRDD